MWPGGRQRRHRRQTSAIGAVTATFASSAFRVVRELRDLPVHFWEECHHQSSIWLHFDHVFGRSHDHEETPGQVLDQPLLGGRRAKLCPGPGMSCWQQRGEHLYETSEKAAWRLYEGRD